MTERALDVTNKGQPAATVWREGDCLTIMGYKARERRLLEQLDKDKLLVGCGKDSETGEFLHGTVSLTSTDEVDRLKDLIRSVIRGDWSITGLQEAIGDL